MAGGNDTANIGGIGWGGETLAQSDVWSDLSAQAERNLPEGRIGGVIAQLRQRGRRADRRAFVFLIALLVLVALGLGYYVVWPFVQSVRDGERRTWARQTATWGEQNARLDAERSALQERLVARLSPAGVPVASGTEQGLRSLLHIPGAETLVAAGDGGAIIRSTDAGATWSPVASGTEQTLYSLLHIPGAETLVAAGGDGAIIRSTDAGATWSPVASGTEQTLFSLLHIPGAETLVAAGWNGAIIRSTDAGASWSPVASGTEQILYALLHIPGTEILVAEGENGAITRSTDAGATWSPVASGTEQILLSLLHIPGAETLVAAGWDGAIIRSTDAGASWAPVASGTDQTLFSLLHIPGAETLVAAGDGGAIIRSTDAGATWSPVASGTEQTLYSLLHIPGAETLVAAGGDGAIIRSTDAGATWSPVASGTEQTLFSLLHIPGAETLIAAGPGGAILHIDDALTKALAALASLPGPATTATPTLPSSGRSFLPPGSAGDAMLKAWIDDEGKIPKLIRALPVISDERTKLDDIISRRRPVEEALTTAKNELESRRDGTATLGDRQAAFGRFMDACRKGSGPDTDGETTQACATAWAAGQAADDRTWWAVLAQQAPPGILLLFLLATLSALYRYNVRLAGFHHGRADALELLDAKITVADLTPLADAMAADKVPFGPGKTPADQATELATALINRSKA